MGSSIHPDNTSEDDLYKEIFEFKRERDTYKQAALHAGVCPSCILEAPEPYGCSDCLNTGWMQGDPYEEIKTLKAKLEEANKALEPDALASIVANIRQGESETPRCEPPSDYDVGIARGWVVRVLKGIDHLRAARRAHSKDGG